MNSYLLELGLRLMKSQEPGLPWRHFRRVCVCVYSQVVGWGGGQEVWVGASAPPAAESALSNWGREAGAGGRARGQREGAVDGHGTAGQAGEGTAGGAAAVWGQETLIFYGEFIQNMEINQKWFEELKERVQLEFVFFFNLSSNLESHQRLLPLLAEL